MNKFFKSMGNQKGSLLVAMLIGLSLVGVAGTAMIGISTDTNSSAGNEVQFEQAFYMGHVGLELSKTNLSNGLKPDVQSVSFDNGSYAITSNPDAGLLTVTTQVGKARHQKTISLGNGGTGYITYLGGGHGSVPVSGTFSKNCIQVDVSAATIHDDQLRGVKLTKVCNNKVTLTQVVMDWDVGTCEEPDDPENTPVTKVTGCQDDYTPFLDPDNSNKVLICHVPPGDTENAHTLSVAISGWENGHEAGDSTSSQHNLDYLGPCEDIKTNPPEDPELSNCVAEFHETEHNHDNMHVDKIALVNTVIYDNTQGIGSPAIGAEAESTVDTTDFNMTANQSYEFTGPDFAIDFDKNLPTGVYFKLSFIFSDESQKKSYFIVTPEGVTVVDPPD